MDILNIELEEKTDQTVRITYRDDTTNLPVNITGYSALMEIRPNFGNEYVIMQLSDLAGNIVLGGAAGTIDLIFKPSDTDSSQITTDWTKAAYDLVLTDTLGKRKKLLKGFITVARSASV